MAWHKAGDKPLPETEMAEFIDTQIPHSTVMSYNIIGYATGACVKFNLFHLVTLSFFMVLHLI